MKHVLSGLWFLLAFSGTSFGLTFDSGGGGSSPSDITNSSGWAVSGTNVYVATTTNKVGIGTASPGYDLEISKSQNAPTAMRVINGQTGSTLADARLEIASGSSTGGDPLLFYQVGGSYSFVLGVDASDSGKFKIAKSTFVGGANTYFTLDTSGSVGIGTQSPATKLHVSSGVLTLDGSAAGFSNSGYMVYVASAITIADNGGGTAAAYTLTPIASYNKITCSDANGCDVTMGESGMIDGTIIRVVNVGTNVANFADTSGVSELTAAFAAGQWDFISFMYTTDRWSEIARSNN
jgi:hypothetical protein